MALLIIAKIVRSKTPILFADIRRMNRGIDFHHAADIRHVINIGRKMGTCIAP